MDINNKEQMTVCIRWVDEDFSVHEDPVELIHLPKNWLKHAYPCIEGFLDKTLSSNFTVPWQVYDGASNMSDHLNGVVAQIRKDFPSALYIHCLAHCTNLCLQSVGCQCIPVWDVLSLVMELSQLIQYSPKRSTLFETLQDQLSPQSPSLKPPCPTQWTVHTAGNNSVISNYTVLREALAEIISTTHNKYGRKAGWFFAQMEKFSTFFGLKLSHVIFYGTEQLSITLQGKDTWVQESINAADMVVKFLERLRVDSSFDEFYLWVVEASKIWHLYQH